MSGSTWYWRVAARAKHRCEYCQAPEWIFNSRFEVEHIVPLAWGGLTFLGNLALACRACNGAKSDQLGLLDPDLSFPIWLFHPRVDVWSDHFRIDLITGEVDGITARGVVTATVLRMNELNPLIARQQWIYLGLIP